LPKLVDHLTGDGEDPTPATPSADMVDSVKADGARRRANRHRRNAALAVLGLGLVAVPAAALRTGTDGDQGLSVSAGGVAPSAESGPVSQGVPTSVSDPVPAGSGPTDTPPPAPVVASPTTTRPQPQGVVAPSSVAPSTVPPLRPPPSTGVTVPACRNSRDPVCGPFRWEKAPPANQPLVASFAKAPPTAVAGQAVSFEVSWSDDAPLVFDRLTTDGSGMAQACSYLPRYGQWTVPDGSRRSGTLPYSTNFANPGVYTVAVYLGTGGCESPFSSDQHVETTITVTAPP